MITIQYIKIIMPDILALLIKTLYYLYRADKRLQK